MSRKCASFTALVTNRGLILETINQMQYLVDYHKAEEKVQIFLKQYVMEVFESFFIGCRISEESIYLVLNEIRKK